MLLSHFFQKGILIFILLLSAATDISCRKIPNVLLLTGFAAVTACKLWTLFQTGGEAILVLLFSAAAAGFSILALFPFYRRKMIGGGDVKLIALILFTFPSMRGLMILFLMFLSAALWFLVNSWKEWGGREIIGQPEADSLAEEIDIRAEISGHQIPLGACALAGSVLAFLLREQ